jgi:hypothetical protein
LSERLHLAAELLSSGVVKRRESLQNFRNRTINLLEYGAAVAVRRSAGCRRS